MFRSLANRLIASYLFAAVLLVFFVALGVTIFALSIYGIGVRTETDAVVRQVPDEVRVELIRGRTLAAAATDIARHLWRPGLDIAVLSEHDGVRDLLAIARSDPQTGAIDLHPIERRGPRIARDPWSHPPGGPPDPIANGRDHMERFPFALNILLRLTPRDVAFPGGRVVLLPAPGALRRTIDAFWLAVVPIGAIAIVVAFLVGRYITGEALRPLVETTASLRRFGAGDFTPQSIVTSDRSEIGELVAAYNAAVAQVAHAFGERRAAELQMRQFIADAGHELRTPLTVLMGFVDVLRRRARGDAADVKIYETMLAESRRMRALIDRLIMLARLENPLETDSETVDLAEIARDVVAPLALAGNARIRLTSAAGTFVRGDPAELRDAVSNLVDNACKYAPTGPIDVEVSTDALGAVVRVRDNGPGISDTDLPHVFDRFYRGNDAPRGEGFGLGLSIVKRAVERAGGAVTLSTSSSGSEFTLRFPAVGTMRLRRSSGTPSPLAIGEHVG